MMVYSGARQLGRAGMVLAVLTLVGCGQIGNPFKAIRGTIPPPDEFQVIARKPIQIPATTDLPEPTPGTRSPLDPDPHGDAVRALTGSAVMVPAASAGTSAGESQLLSAANASAANTDIRVQLESDKIDTTKGKPYQPPTLAQVLGLSDGREKVDEKELLDPLAESQRLQTAGVVAPANPEAEPEAPQAAEPPPMYPVTQQQVRNPLSSVAPPLPSK